MLVYGWCVGVLDWMGDWILDWSFCVDVILGKIFSR